MARWNRSARRRDRCRGDLAGVDPPGGVRGFATKVPTHQSNTGQQAQRSCVSAGRCAHRAANRWAIKITFPTAKGEPGWSTTRPGTDINNSGAVATVPTATAPKDAFRKKSRRLVSVMVTPFPQNFRCQRRSSKQGTTVRTTPRGFIPGNGASPITKHSVTTTCTAPLKRSLLKWPPRGDCCDSWCAHTHRHRISTVCHSSGSLRRHGTSHDTPRGLLSHCFGVVVVTYPWSVGMFCAGWALLAATGPPRQTLLRGLPVSFENSSGAGTEDPRSGSRTMGAVCSGYRLSSPWGEAAALGCHGWCGRATSQPEPDS